MTIYIVIGTRENVFQDTVGGEFMPHPDKEIVKVFSSGEKAREFVANCKLKIPISRTYGDTSYYQNGYYDMEIESHSVEN